MCGIAGYVLLDPKKRISGMKLQYRFHSILKRTSERGKDSWGIIERGGKNGDELIQWKYPKENYEWGLNYYSLLETGIFNQVVLPAEIPIATIANFRAEPTTEIVNVQDQITIQPFGVVKGDFAAYVAHNGIIYNDSEILEESSPVFEFASRNHAEKPVDSWAIVELIMQNHMKIVQDKDTTHIPKMLNKLKGSFALAILCSHGPVILARNYRALAIKVEQIGKGKVLFFASKPEYLDDGDPYLSTSKYIPEYSYIKVYPENKYIARGKLFPVVEEIGRPTHAVVICSGGLDSTTAATIACHENDCITLLHFTYKCKAQDREVMAVTQITGALQRRFSSKIIDYKIIDLDFLSQLGGSTLTEGPDDKIATFDTGAETHNEWVPARNLLMIAMTASYCDRHRIGKIYLGLNLEEAGAFPDNTTEFYEKLSNVLSIGTLARPIIINPLGNMVKHEIYSYAKEIEAPIHLSWSCYKGGELHCGTCGPCWMRKKAAERGGFVDNIQYEN